MVWVWYPRWPYDAMVRTKMIKRPKKRWLATDRRKIYYLWLPVDTGPTVASKPVRFLGWGGYSGVTNGITLQAKPCTKEEFWAAQAETVAARLQNGKHHTMFLQTTNTEKPLWYSYDGTCPCHRCEPKDWFRLGNPHFVWWASRPRKETT